MDELFDVFEAAPQDDSDSESSSASSVAPSPATGTAPAPAPATADAGSAPPAGSKSKKRKADGAIKDDENEKETDVDMADVDTNSKDESSDEPISDEHDEKRRKKEGEGEAAPVLTDSFNTAASRELAAAPTMMEGQAAAEGESLVLSHNIQHQVALPPNLDYEYVPLTEHKAPDEPARTFPFKLDPFQSLAVASIEREESVLVSAHTSAGKTVVAEYAIAQCLKRRQRVIYTSPIKALSNQKFRDFQREFGDVGLMTGDVTINPTASCLVMTTEILRSMLYRGSEIIREAAWVIFDEVHYLRDASRGVVWEETIILLPDKVRYVFLSATIPNAMQFAEWIAKIHHQACHVVYTDFRPTPLQNYVFPAGHNQIIMVVDEKRNFKQENFNNAMALIEERKGDPLHMKGKGKNKKTDKPTQADSKSDIAQIIKMIIRKKFDPVIVFNFSKRECENLALQITNFCFNNESEKGMVRTVFTKAIEGLAPEDRQLPQISHILPLLERGIGVHHSGLLPILKEIIEILFQEGLVKVLFATETFAIGLNMPARTVLFTQITKWDGQKRRPLTPGEYIQMSGRAGRRGLDARGLVIMMMDESMPPEDIKNVVHGEQERLNSAFYLGYNMILNLLRIESVSPEYMLERCFYQFQNAASVPHLERDLMALQHKRDTMAITDEMTIKDYYTLRRQLNHFAQDMRIVMQHPVYCAPFLKPGRLVRIYDPRTLNDDVLDHNRDYGWGVVLSYTKRRPVRGEPEYRDQDSLLLDILLYVSGESNLTPALEGNEVLPRNCKPANASGKKAAQFKRIPCLLSCVKAVGQIKLFMGPDPDTAKGVDAIRRQFDECMRRFTDGIPCLDPLEHMEIKDDSFKKLLGRIEVLESRLLSNPLHGDPRLPELWEQYTTKLRLGEEIKEKKKAIAKAHQIGQMEELKARKRVLRRLTFINDRDVVQLKARVACELSTTQGHELLLSELLFERFFNDMSPELVAAVLSCFVFDEKIAAKPLNETLDKPYREIVAKARHIVKVSQESKLDLEEEEYLDRLKPQLMETVYLWAQGRPFGEICNITDTFEGSLIRHFRRLEELIRQMAQAGKVMGSDELLKKFEESLGKIRRDLVAAQSLYL